MQPSLVGQDTILSVSKRGEEATDNSEYRAAALEQAFS